MPEEIGVVLWVMVLWAGYEYSTIEVPAGEDPPLKCGDIDCV